MDSLKGYKHPRDRVTALLRDQIITRIKKGLYILNRAGAPPPAIREVLANMIYGPSYISLQYALHMYGMIPEYARQITSVTMKKTKHYQTPVGDFIYRSVPPSYYVPGILRKDTAGLPFLVASREKALLDTVYFAAGLNSLRDLRSFITEDLRIDYETLRTLDMDELLSIAAASGSVKLRRCVEVLETLRK
jgi:predicted transcriptional regulator of viral defense system